jgi:hypothetical protein
MKMQEAIAKLNRLRKKAGQKQLTSWKGSQDQLETQIKRLEAEGYEDPGPPKEIDFGPNSKADTPPTAKEIPALNRGASGPDSDKLHHMPTRLARGVEGPFTEHGRKAMQDLTASNKKTKKAKFKDNKDGSATKTTTSGKKRHIGKELNEQIKEQRVRKHADARADEKNFTIADLARELGMDAKVARAKLRRHEDEIKKLHTKGQDRWVFPNSAKKSIAAILKPKA